MFNKMATVFLRWRPIYKRRFMHLHVAIALCQDFGPAARRQVGLLLPLFDSNTILQIWGLLIPLFDSNKMRQISDLLLPLFDSTRIRQISGLLLSV